MDFLKKRYLMAFGLILTHAWPVCTRQQLTAAFRKSYTHDAAENTHGLESLKQAYDETIIT